MRVLLAGGTGFVGRALIDALLTDGHEPVVLSRRSVAPPGLPDRALLINWPGPSHPFPSGALSGIEAVVNLAGESIGAGRWTKARKDALYTSRIQTTRALVDAIAASPEKPDVLISASAVGYYGSYSDGEAEFTEASPPGGGFLARLCSHWEDEAKALVRHGVRLALLRIGLVLDRDGGVLPRMMLPFRFGIGGPVGSGHQVISWIHRRDLVDIMRLILRDSELSGPFNACTPSPVTNREFSRSLGQAMHRPAFMPTPTLALRMALGEMAELVLLGQRVAPRRLLEIGFDFRYPELPGALEAIFNQG